MNKIKKEEFEKLFYEGKTSKEIAKLLNVTIDQVGYFKRSNNYKSEVFSESDKELSEIQKQFIYGSVLGDLNIQLGKQAKNAKLTIVHCEAQKELFLNKVEILEDFMGKYKLYNTLVDKRTGKIYPTYRGNSRSHKEFTKIYNEVYPDGKKYISKEFLNKITHPIALAFWFMDDGTSRGTIATNSFSLEEIENLLEFLKENFNIVATKQKNLSNYVIHISAESRLLFEQLIFPYMVPSMYYKLIYLEQLEKSV